MNALPSPLGRGRDQTPGPCGSSSLQQNFSRCPAGLGSGSRLSGSPGAMGGLFQGPHRATKPQRELSPEEQQELRRKINSRERKRMQDLNVAMDALREVMVPYASSPSSSPSSSSSSPSSSGSHSHQAGAPPGRRLSKISTLVLARNYILLLGSSLQEMRRMLGEVSVGVGVGVGVNAGPVPRLLLGGWPLLTGPSQLLLSAESLLTSSASSTSSSKCPLLPPGPLEAPMMPLQWGPSGGPGGGPLCSCGVCRLPRFSHSGPRFPK